ncbi:MAG: serine/threonine-protein kinase [Holosporaceae bacterium]|nr:serine/threonine-protein kinase [Holosporaceae bacterium]
MNKKRLFCKGKLSITLIAFGLLSNLNAASQGYLCTFDPRKSIVSQIEMNEDERRFLENLQGVPIPADTISIRLMRELGEGTYGKVCEGIYPDGTAVIVKVFKGEERVSRMFMLGEAVASRRVLEGILGLLRPENHISESMSRALQSITLSVGIGTLAVGDSGSEFLVQRRVNGSDVFHTVTGRRAPYGLGFPDDCRNALSLASNFCCALAILHGLGFDFIDLHCGNVMIEPTEGSWACRLIDFGLLSRNGKPLHSAILNQPTVFIPPEHRERHERTDLVAQLKEVDALIRQHEEPYHGELSEDHMKLIQVRNELIDQISACDEIRDHSFQGRVTPAFDIYKSAFILDMLLFGVLRVFGPDYNYQHSREDAQVILEKREAGYSPLVFVFISVLLKAMLNDDPDERPSAEIAAQAFWTLAHAPEKLLQAMVNADSFENRIFETIHILEEFIPSGHPMLVHVFASDNPNEQPFGREIAIALAAIYGAPDAQAEMSSSSFGNKRRSAEVVASALLFLIGLVFIMQHHDEAGWLAQLHTSLDQLRAELAAELAAKSVAEPAEELVAGLVAELAEEHPEGDV